MILGREVTDWVDIYSLQRFHGKQPASLKDLYEWRAPASPDGCLKLAMELCQARKLHDAEAQVARDWLCDFLKGTHP